MPSGFKSGFGFGQAQQAVQECLYWHSGSNFTRADAKSSLWMSGL